jgi:phosphate transport system substrate-binding protein
MSLPAVVLNPATLVAIGGGKMKNSVRRSSVAVLVLALALAGVCVHAQSLDTLPPYKPAQKVSGAVRVFGSELKGNVAALEEGFLKIQPDVVFANNFMTSSEGAMAGLYTGLSDLSPAGDDAKITDQMPFFNTFRYLPLEISLATGGYEKRGTLWAIVIVVNKDNPLAKLTLKQLEGIFGSERTGGWDGIDYTSKFARGPEGNIRTWGQLGLKGEWADKPIHTYGYSAPGFAYYFQRKLFHGSDKWNPNYHQYVEAKETTNDDFGKAVASERMLEDLSKDKYGIAWAAVMHTKDYPQVKPVSVASQDEGPYVELTPDNVRNRTYPLIRDAYVYLNRAPGRPIDTKVKEFLRYVLSREGQEVLAAHGEYYPLTEDVLREQLKKLD